MWCLGDSGFLDKTDHNIEIVYVNLDYKSLVTNLTIYLLLPTV